MAVPFKSFICTPFRIGSFWGISLTKIFPLPYLPYLKFLRGQFWKYGIFLEILDHSYEFGNIKSLFCYSP